MPFASLLSAIVVVCGLMATVAIVVIGLSQLEVQSDQRSALRCQLLSETLAERLSVAAPDTFERIIERTASRSSAELLLANAGGEVIVDGTVHPPPQPGIVQLLRVGSGETETRLGRARFFTTRLRAPRDDLYVISFVSAPRTPLATDSLVRSVGAYSFLLLMLAALVALALSRDVRADVTYLTQRIRQMAKEEVGPAGEPVPLRTLDEVGAMTHSFNELVQRFTAAERSYRDDLSLAVSIERDKSAFLAALSHELKTPLNVILGFADVLLAEVEGPLNDDARESLSTLRDSGTHLKALIKDILDLSALESGELTLTRGLTNVYVIASNVLSEHKMTASAKQLELRLEGESAIAWSDPIRVRQIIGNLVSNAVKFTQKGFVEVRVGRDGDDAMITVEDTGPGIARGDQGAIFEDFSQVGDLKARGAGTGLGLAITRRLVRMHGGRVSLESQIGKGAKFTIWLPSGPFGQADRKSRPSSISERYDSAREPSR